MAVVVNEEWQCCQRIKELRARGKPLITRQGNFGSVKGNEVFEQLLK